MNIKVKENLEAFYLHNVWKDCALGDVLTFWSKKYSDRIALKEAHNK